MQYYKSISLYYDKGKECSVFLSPATDKSLEPIINSRTAIDFQDISDFETLFNSIYSKESITTTINRQIWASALGIVIDYQLLNYFSVIEVYSNEPSKVSGENKLKKVINSLPNDFKKDIKYNGSTLNANTDDFSRRAARTRNYKAHGKLDNKNHYNDLITDIYELSETVKILKIIGDYCMLKQIGIDDNILIPRLLSRYNGNYTTLLRIS